MIKEKKPEKIILDLFYAEKPNRIKEMIGRCHILCINKSEATQENIDSETVLYITDSSAKASEYKSQNQAVLVYLHEGNQSESFPQNRYFIEGFEDADDRYFIRIYQREKKIPWTIGETERLCIREMCVGDTEALYRLYEDKSVVEFMEDLPGNREEEKEYIAEYIDKVYGLFGFGMWFVELKETKELIGRVGFQNCELSDEQEETVELGFMIIPQYQRQGYAYEACKAAVTYMQEVFPEYKIKARCKKENKAGISLCKKLGIECRVL
ncbi:MAG: GNAT family N-acetyltransferase [Lachnospiraceae bacterium]|nr:GNAT family N-acetyltransferase [Lachnospiraceae bacterium]